jgi:hypothetical protein
MTQSSFRTMKTSDGIILELYKEEGRNAVPHSMDGPAIKYPKSMKRVDEYFIYGIRYTKEQWEEARESSKVNYMPIDPKLEA